MNKCVINCVFNYGLKMIYHEYRLKNDQNDQQNQNEAKTWRV